MTSISLFFLLLLSATATLSSDISALKAIKEAIDPTTIPASSCLASWNFTSDPCTNPLPTHFLCGLSCGFDRITGLFFDSVGYAGTLSPIISQLTGLQAIFMGDNLFSGPIPTTLASLPNLVSLDLRNNLFSGRIPASIFAIPSLINLNLRNNLFSGTIPPFISITKTLIGMDLSNNSLSGSLPHTLSSSNIVTLNLSFNKFTGPIPILPQTLETLTLKSNKLSGHLTNTSFNNLTQLNNADLSGNSLSGTIPGWFFLQPRLERVNLSSNSFTGIEALKSNKTRLIELDAGYNKIVGYVSTNFTVYPSLLLLSLRHNKLKGAIPKFNTKMTMMRILFLDGNYLNGNPSKEEYFSLKSIVTGSFGDNCLKRCPSSSQLCLIPQKPSSVCRKAYGGKMKV